MFMYVDDCRKYYFCVDGAQLLITCPKGLLFDFTSLSCKAEDEADCLPGATTPQPNPCLDAEDGSPLQPHPGM